MNTNSLPQDTVRNISRILVAEIAPEELDNFDELFDEARTASNSPSSRNSSDEALGFGLDALIIIATPAVKTAVMAVMTFIVNEVIDNAKNETATIIKERIKNIFDSNKKSKSPASPPNKETLRRIQKMAEESAKLHGLSEEQSNKFAMVLVGLIATEF
jgi:hypothetical protein